MKYGPAITVLILAMMICPLVMAEPVIADDEPQTITICGYVGDISTEGNKPLDDVVVRILDANMNAITECVTGSDTLEPGEFRMTYPASSGKYISFDCEGYTARTWPGHMNNIENNIFSFDISRITPDDDGVYNITGNLNEGSFVAMSITTAHIMGYVISSDRKPINGANVTIVSSDNRISHGTTDSNGYFEINCYYGTYSLEVSCNGFEKSETIFISTNDPAPVITLSMKNHSMLWGLDTPHTMELLGVVCVGMVFLLLALIHHKSKSKDSEIVFVNDLEDDDNNVKES